MDSVMVVLLVIFFIAWSYIIYKIGHCFGVLDELYRQWEECKLIKEIRYE